MDKDVIYLDLSLESAIAMATHWDYTCDAVTGEPYYRAVYSAATAGRYTRDQFAALHAELPDLVDMLAGHQFGDAVLPATVLDSTVDLWSCERFDLPREAVIVDESRIWGLPLPPVLSLGMLSSLKPCDGVSLKLTSQQFVLAENPLPSMTQYAVKEYAQEIFLSIDWLDRHLPGWGQRLDVAAGLGMPDEQQAEYCLHPLRVDHTGRSCHHVNTPRQLPGIV